MSRVFRPRPGQFGFNIVINEALNPTAPAANVFIVNDRRVTAAQVGQLHAQQRAVIAFFDAAAASDASDETALPDNVIGDKAHIYSTDPCCPPRDWLDIEDAAVLNLMQARVRRVQALGVDGIVWNGLPNAGEGAFAPSAATIRSYANQLVSITRAAGLAVGLGQSLEHVPALVGSFDFALVANCVADGTCGKLSPFISANKAVFGYELDGGVLAMFATCGLRGSVDLVIKGSDREDLRNNPLVMCSTYSLANSAFLTTTTSTVATVATTTFRTVPGQTTTRPTSFNAVVTTSYTGTTTLDPFDSLPPTPARSLFVAEQPPPVPPPSSLALPIGLAIGAALIVVALLAIALFVCKKSQRDEAPGTSRTRRDTAIATVETLGPTGGTMATSSTASSSTGVELMRHFPKGPTPRDAPHYSSGAVSAVPAYEELHLRAATQATGQFGSWAPQPSARGYEIGTWHANQPVSGTTGPVHLTNMAYSFDSQNPKH
jgi:hypothetical protein